QSDDYTYVLHLAAIIGVVHVLNRPYEVLRDNVAMLANMIEFGKRQKAMKRFMFASTSEIYAGTLMHFDLPIPTPESTPLAILPLEHPRTSYMLSKIYGEAMCQHSGIPFTIIRPHNIYGPRMGMAHVIPEQLRKMHEAAPGDSIEVFSMDHRRSFCYVSDAVEMITRMLESEGCENQALNLGREAPEVTIQEVAETCRSTVGKDLVLDSKPAQPGSPARRAPDMSKTTELTGFAAEIDLATGIQLSYDWYRERIFEGNSVTAK
ncbi:MAG: NAD-dependent epimerase/dehydratase family protein, partial [Gammaproteobacteria bacterium]